MKDVIQWLYYIRLSKYSRGHEDTIIEVHSKWVNDRLRWIKDHRGASNTLYKKVLNNYDRSIKLLEDYMI